jgi:mannosyltransferase OCH1-like enzyme
MKTKRITIPHIIHQTAPRDKNKWPQIWHTCQQSWKTHFPHFKYMMWHDEDLDHLMKNDFPEFYSMYKNYPKNIQRFDVARYFILYKYGGIYADMDYMCVKPFFNKIPHTKVSISESPWKEHEYLQNSLMISPRNNIFWKKVIQESINRYSTSSTRSSIVYSTGPLLITDVYKQHKHKVNVLPYENYNPVKKVTASISSDVNTIHYHTQTW